MGDEEKFPNRKPKARGDTQGRDQQRWKALTENGEVDGNDPSLGKRVELVGTKSWDRKERGDTCRANAFSK